MNYEFPAKRKESFPPMDIIETKDGYTFEMELCGLSENDIDLSIKDQVLSIGTKKSDEKEVVTNQNSTENKSVEETKQWIVLEQENCKKDCRGFEDFRSVQHIVPCKR